MIHTLRNKRRIMAHDRRMAAIHEAGHVVIAHKLDLKSFSSIRPVYEPGHDLLENKLWTGSTSIISFSYPKVHKRMIAVAGAIAEVCWENRNSDKVDFDYCLEYEDWPALGLHYEQFSEVMSESDWRLSGCRPCYPDAPFFTAVKKVLRLLRPDCGPLWPEVIRVARRLVNNSRIHERKAA
jgi:hypothetical protein